MASRKTLMIDKSDAFLTLPGGLGTLDELFEVWTTATLALHAKPMVLLDTDGFYRPPARLAAARSPTGASSSPPASTCSPWPTRSPPPWTPSSPTSPDPGPASRRSIMKLSSPLPACRGGNFMIDRLGRRRCGVERWGCRTGVMGSS